MFLFLHISYLADKQVRARAVPGPSDKRLTGNGGKLNSSQAEPVAANSRAVGQFLSISCEAFR